QFGRATDDFKIGIFVVAIPRNVGGLSDKLNTRQRSQPSMKRFVEVNKIVILGITFVGEIDVEGEDVVGLKAHFNLLQILKGAHQQAGARKQYQRECHF